jgi:hypothetical protein
MLLWWMKRTEAQDRRSAFSVFWLQRGLWAIIKTHLKKKIVFVDEPQPPKEIDSPVGKIHADDDFFPSNGHPTIEEEAVERFEFEELGFAEVASYEQPYFSVQIGKVCHRFVVRCGVYMVKFSNHIGFAIV